MPAANRPIFPFFYKPNTELSDQQPETHINSRTGNLIATTKTYTNKFYSFTRLDSAGVLLLSTGVASCSTNDVGDINVSDSRNPRPIPFRKYSKWVNVMPAILESVVVS